MKRISAIVIMALCLLLAGCKSVKTVPAIELGNMDTTVDAAEDFYRYCNGNWLKNTPIPEDNSIYDVFTVVNERTKLQIKEIIEEAIHDKNAEQGGVTQKIGDFYNAGMDTVAINKRGYSELLPYFEKIDKISDKRQLATLIGQLHDEGFRPFFTAGLMVDWKNRDRYIMVVFQEGMSLPVGDLYLDEETEVIRDKYVEHIAKMFKLTGTGETIATEKAKNVLDLETALAKITMPIEEMLDPQKLYHFKSLKELQASIPNFNWDNYFTAIGAPDSDSLNVASPNFFTALDSIILSTDLNTIEDYLRWKVITNSAPHLSDDLVTEDFNFSTNSYMGKRHKNPAGSAYSTRLPIILRWLLANSMCRNISPPKPKNGCRRL